MLNARRNFLLTVGGLLTLLVIALVVQSHIPVDATGNLGNWGAPLEFSPESHAVYTPQQSLSATEPQDRSTTPTNTPDTQNPATLHIETQTPDTSAQNTAHQVVSTNSAFDFNTFMQQLTSTAPKKYSPNPLNQAHVSPNQPDVYASIPPQLIIPAQPSNIPVTEKTDLQKSLARYGNDAGTIVKTYELMHANDADIVQGYFDHRTDPTKAAALVQLANDLKSVGLQLQSIQNVPTPALSTHATLAATYVDIGDKLAALTRTQSDADLIQAINTYDTAVEIYAKSYTSLVLLFSQFNVTFRSDEPGSVFMFSAPSL